MKSHDSIPNRLAGAALGAWSALLLHFHFSGRLAAHLAPPFRGYALAAGIVLGLMALVLLCVPGQLRDCQDAACAYPAGFHIGKRFACGMLLLPVLLAVIAGEGEFSAALVLNRGEVMDASELPGHRPRVSAASRDVELPLPAADGAGFSDENTPDADPADYLPRTPEGYIAVEVLDLLYAAQDEAMRQDFEGKTVQLVGQFLREASQDVPHDPRTRRFKAVRLFMVCCAADAKPVATLVECEALPEAAEMSWLRITGTAVFPVFNGKRTVVIRASAIEPTPPPEERMLF